MTASRKVFVAGILLAAGYGTAWFLGGPAAQERAAALIGSSSRTLPKPAAPNSDRPDDAPYLIGDVRLVPDFDDGEAKHSAPVAQLHVASPPLWNSNEGGASSAVVESAPAQPGVTSRATLRNEAPRPLVIESSHEAPPMLSPPPWSHAPAAQDAEVQLQGYGGVSTTPSEFGAPLSAPTITASYHGEADAGLTLSPVSPPPWPELAEDNGPRRHIIVDGDSLARLAGLYLDDPRRSGEIFEANRGVLSNPDLLPIGTELVIPHGSHGATDRENSPQSLRPSAVAVHAPANGRLVPVGPIPAAQHVVPRAQLSRPIAAE